MIARHLRYMIDVRLVLCVLLLCSCSVALGQQKTVTGTVRDTSGSLPGVVVEAIGTKNATQTDGNGKYKITVSANSVLSFRMVGYAEQRIEVGNRQVVDVRLVSTTQGLDEVVVVAFGAQKKATVTGAISSISTKEIKQSPAANLAVTLAGRLPGLTAIQKSGEPGRDVTNLYVRGQGTVNSQSPIVMVDGIERDLTYIDPNEVESVTILKDASSTAIFGVRGANGVILVTTRRGTSEIPQISLSTEYGAQNFTRLLQPVNSYQYATLRNQAQRNDGLADAFSASAVEHYRLQDDPLRYPNTDWNKILLKDLSFQQRYNLNVSGIGKSVKYFVNAGYLKQGGQFKTEDNLAYDPSFKLDRYNFRSNIDIQLNKTLKAYLNVAGYIEKANTPYSAFNNYTGTNAKSQALAANSPALWIVSYMHDLNATIPGPIAPNGAVVTSSTLFNPAYGLINRNGYIQQTRSNMTATYGMEQSLDALTKGLTFRLSASFDASTINNLFAGRTYERVVQVIDPVLKGKDGRDSVYFRPYNTDKNSPLSIVGERNFTSQSNFQAALNYQRTFGKHAVTGLLLAQKQQKVIDADLPYNLIGTAARVTYGYNNKYFAEFNAGYNGSEQFAKGRRFGFFPAFSGGWLVSNEKFLSDNKVLTLLKLRGSYGLVGNDRIGSSRFLYLDNIQITTGGYSSSLGLGQRASTILLKNEALQWEVAKKTNIGVEIGLFTDLNLSVDLFNEKRDNVLITRGSVPSLNGLSSSVIPPVNIGKVENKGYEVELNYKKAFKHDLFFMSKINFNYAINKQTFADEPALPADYPYPYRKTGYQIGQRFGYIVEGYFNSAAEIAASPVQNVGGHQTLPGDFKYKDVNGDGVVNDRDKVPLGYASIPSYTFGAAFNLRFKGFDISALFQGAARITNYYSGRGIFSALSYFDQHLNSWTPERAAAGEPISYPRLTTQTSPNELENSFFIRDASYIRLKNVEIGYSFSENFLKKIKVKGIRLYVNGLNLITWDRLPWKNFDPEINGESSFPITRLFNAGANFTF